jgi:glycosyltransferase involved in cell wall biosynthesis
VAVIKIEVLMVAGEYYPQLGGIASVVREISERLVKKGHKCTVLTLNPGSEQNDDEINNVYVKRVNSSVTKWLYGISPEICLYLKRNRTIVDKANIIHIHGYHSLLSLEMIYLTKKRFKHKKMIFSPHYLGRGQTTFSSVLHNIYKPIGRWMFRRVDNVICVSEYESKMVQRDFLVDPESIRVIPIGVSKITATKRKKEKKDHISLLSVGRITEYKGIQFILMAMEELEESYNIKSTLTVVGTGDFKSELNKLSRKLSLESKVIWLSNLSQEELDQQYERADLFLLLSRAESYGLVVAEALAHGTPCIVTNISAQTEFINETGCFGVDYPPDDEKLAELIVKISSSNVQVGPFSSKIRTWDSVADDYEGIYSSL